MTREKAQKDIALETAIRRVVTQHESTRGTINDCTTLVMALTLEMRTVISDVEVGQGHDADQITDQAPGQEQPRNRLEQVIIEATQRFDEAMDGNPDSWPLSDEDRVILVSFVIQAVLKWMQTNPLTAEDLRDFYVQQDIRQAGTEALRSISRAIERARRLDPSSR